MRNIEQAGIKVIQEDALKQLKEKLQNAIENKVTVPRSKAELQDATMYLDRMNHHIDLAIKYAGEDYNPMNAEVNQLFRD